MGNLEAHCQGPHRPYELLFGKQEGVKMSKQAMRDETERMVKEALEHKAVRIKQGMTRVESKCVKCGVLNRVSAAQGQVRLLYRCKERGDKQKIF
jgi:hypothetical protein